MLSPIVTTDVGPPWTTTTTALCTSFSSPTPSTLSSTATEWGASMVPAKDGGTGVSTFLLFVFFGRRQPLCDGGDGGGDLFVFVCGA